MATVVTRTRLNIKLYVHCLSSLLLHKTAQKACYVFENLEAITEGMRYRMFQADWWKRAMICFRIMIHWKVIASFKLPL
jgi:hypothetical protein